eukprot:symbB.v1.2.042270.t1/scaffold9626.1/size2705/1
MHERACKLMADPRSSSLAAHQLKDTMKLFSALAGVMVAATQGSSLEEELIMLRAE